MPRADCRPPREVLLRVFTAGGRDGVVIGSTPLSAEDRNWQQFEWRHTRAGEGCIHLPGNAEGGEFLIGVTSVSEDPSHLARVTLAGTPGDGSIVSASYGSSAWRRERGTDLGGAASLVLPSRRRPRALPSAVGGELRETLERTKALHDVWRASHEEAMARNQALIAELGRPDWSSGASSSAVARSSLKEGWPVTTGRASAA